MDSARPDSQLPKLVSALEMLTEEELVQLNRIVVARIRLMQQIRAHQSMIKLRVGQRVQFTDASGTVVRGVLVKHNRKSVTIVADGGVQWRVAPTLLKPEG